MQTGVDSGARGCFAGAMSEVGILLLFGLGVALVIFFGWLSWKQEKERTAALAALANRFGWAFSGEAKDHDFNERYAQFACFQRGHSRYAHNQMRGVVELWGLEAEAQAGDFHYKITRNNGKTTSTTTYRISYLLVKLPFGARLPSLALRPEGFMDKLAGAIGFDDIDFESAEFSRRYHVGSSDRKFAYDVLHPRMIDWMLNINPPAFEISRGVLLLVAGQRWSPSDFGGAKHWAEEFLKKWPDYLVRDLNAR